MQVLPISSTRFSLVVGAVLWVLAVGFSPLQSLLAQTPSEVRLEFVVDGLQNPVDLTGPGDGSNRLFIAQRDGRIRIYDTSLRQLLATPFLDISGLISTGDERGLLGMAFHPNFAANKRFFLNFTDQNGDTVVARFTVSADPNRANPTPDAVLLTVSQPFSNHNGGQVQFGPDGFLYIALGDGGSAGDPNNFAQDLTVLLGKLLRLDADSSETYVIPSTNPFAGDPQARGEIWAYGLRNPWRFSFDRTTDEMFIADVGQSTREEVDFQPSNSGGGENYGWRRMEGSLCFNPPTDCNDGTLILPLLEYEHTSGNCSITGGYRYRGRLFPRLAGVYFYADFCSGRIWGAVKGQDATWTSTELLDTDFNIATFGEDDDGEIYVADFFGGRIFQIVEVKKRRGQLVSE